MRRLFRPLIRLFLTATVLAGVLVGVLVAAPREARASVAPICDPRGASAIAPPPVMPVKDINLEAGDPPLPCRNATPLDFARLPRSSSPDLVVVSAAMVDAFSASDQVRRPPSSTSCQKLTFAFVCPRERAGFSPSVFRPPRW